MHKIENIAKSMFFENICQYILPSNTLRIYASVV
jgi:hypothetical protein